MTIWRRLSISCYLLTKNTKTMREELLPHPQDTHSWFTAWRLYTAPNGCYAAKRNIRFEFRPSTPQQIAYSNDRYRLMHEMYQKHPSPKQSLRWHRSPEGETGVMVVHEIGPWAMMTYDNETFASLGLCVNASQEDVVVENDQRKLISLSWLQEKGFYEVPEMMGLAAKDFRKGLVSVLAYANDARFSIRGMSKSGKMLNQTWHVIKYQDEVESFYIRYMGEDMDSVPYVDGEDCPKNRILIPVNTASALSDQDLEDLANSKITFGLTKDNITHIESSLSAKDYDATYAHSFWVQMGKDCNWEPLTLALYYFRYRDSISKTIKK